jgi:outer membrane protein TolC
MKVPILFALGVCAGAAVALSAANVANAEYINALTEELRTNNSALWAARSRITAAEENAKSIPLWSDPEMMAGGMATDQRMREEQGDLAYGIEQKLPVLGKERSLRAAARTEIGVEEAGFDYEFQTLRKKLAIAVIDAALADEILVLTGEDLAWLKTLEGAVERRYAAGQAPQADLLRVQNEGSLAAQRFNADENDRHAMYVELNRILNRGLVSAWAQTRLPQPAPVLPVSELLLKLAVKSEPRLKLMRKELERAEAGVELSRKQARPDISAAIEGRHYSRGGEFRSGEVLLKMTIPWLNRDKYAAAVRRDEARVQEIRSRIEDHTYEVRAEVHHLATKIENARREAVLYRDEIIPRSTLALKSAQAAWTSSRDAFRDVLEARRMLIEGRAAYFKAVAEQYRNMAEIVLCCGLGDLEALENLANNTLKKGETE